MNLDDYRKYSSDVKVSAREETQEKQYDNSILEVLGLSLTDLKIKV